MSLRQSNSFGRWVVYGIAIVPLLVTLGYYFLEHVPSREEYFLNLRFRTLGVMGKQIETKLAAVSSGLTYGLTVEAIEQAQPDGSSKRLTLEEYVSRVFPGLLAFGDPGKPAKIDPNIDFVRAADRVRFTVGPGGQGWEDSLTRLIRPFTEDPIFDDVLLADKPGVVLFQRSDSTPKVRDVAAFLKKPDAKDAGALQIFHRLHSEGSGSDTDLLRDVDLDGSGYRFLTQPLTIRVPRSTGGKVQELLLCGLVRSDTIRHEAMHVPPKYLLWIIVPLFAGVLSGPLLKLMLIRRTGRFDTRDLPLLALFSCLAMAMLTVVLLAYHLSHSDTQRLEQSSKDLAERLALQVRECFRRGRQVLKEVDQFALQLDAGKTAPVAINRTGVWSWGGLVNQAKAVTKTNLEFIYWTSADGLQIEKWTPLETNTPFYPQQTSTHYQRAVAGQFWRDWEDPDSPFTAELLVSPTTSSPIAVLTMKSKRRTELRLSAERRAIEPGTPASLQAAYVSVVETPRNLLSPVIPPATGFALVQPDGSVLYHSDHDRILNENLFRETENSTAIQEAVATQSEKPVEGRYRGSDVKFYVRPIPEVTGLPWTIVVFREIEPWQTLVWQVGLDVLVLYLALWALPVLAVPAVLLIVRWRKGIPWNSCRILALRYFWPQEHAAGCYRSVVAIEAGLIVVFLGLFAWFGKQPDGAAGTVLLISALLLPLAALAVWTWQIRRLQQTGKGECKPRWRPVYVTAVSLTLMSSSILPVTAFFHLAFRMESEIDIMHWQGDLANRVLKHRADAEAEVRQLDRLPADSVAVALKLALPATETGHCDNELLYQSWAGTTIECKSTSLREPKPPEPDSPVWTTFLRFMRVRAMGLEPDTVPVGKFQYVIRSGSTSPKLTVLRAGGPDIVVTSKVDEFLLLPRLKKWWVLASILLIAGCVWVWSAVSRLFLFDFREIPLPTLKQLQGSEWKNPILVLGLPRSGKDGAVSRFIDSIEAARGDTPGKAARARVDLKTEKLDEAWLKRVIEGTGLAAFCNPPAVDLGPAAISQAAAAAGGVTVTPQPASVKIPDYVHLTNLEAAIEDRNRRDIAMTLLDALVRAHREGRLKLVITSVVDPVFHFDIIFPDQSDAVNRNKLPETDFGRWAHVFLNFERVLVDENPPQAQTDEKAVQKWNWRDDLREECRHHKELVKVERLIEQTIEQRPPDGIPKTHEQVISELYEKTFALYKLLWSACTRPEKLLLVQLAQTGLVNPICKTTLQDLLRKRLVLLRPYPTIMNDSFTRFLQSAATGEQIQTWEMEAGESHWHTVRNVLIIIMVFAFLMIGVSQDHALQSISGILTAVVGGIGGVFKLTETIALKWGKKQAAGAGSV